jgi:hypothetical protein
MICAPTARFPAGRLAPHFGRRPEIIPAGCLDFSARLSAERAKTHIERIPRWLQDFHWLESTFVTLNVLGRWMT